VKNNKNQNNDKVEFDTQAFFSAYKEKID